MGKEGDKRRSALFRMKLLAVTFFILGFVLLLCAGLGTDYNESRSSGPPYFVGGFIVGPMAIIVAMLLVYVLVGAIDKSVDNDEIKKLATRISCQYSVSTLLFPACFTACILTGLWGINYDAEDDDDDDSNKTLAIILLVGIILVFLTDLVALQTVRSYGKYFGVVLGRKGRQTAIVSSNTSTNRGVTRPSESGLVIQNNVNVISTDAQRQHVNQLEQQNRLLQQQIALQQQMISQQRQQQQQFGDGLYPPPPPSYSDSDPAYPPMTSFPERSAPPPAYSKIT